MPNMDKIMAINVCKSIATTGDCDEECRTCPLDSGEFSCGKWDTIREAAQAYLDAHKEKEKTMTREEAIIAMVKGEKVYHLDSMECADSYYYYEDGAFLLKEKSISKQISINNFIEDGWTIYRLPIKKWQWAYKSKDQLVHKPRGEVTKHLTEAVAKELYGNDIIKLPFTEIEE